MKLKEYEFLERCARAAGPRGVVIVALVEGEKDRAREPLEALAGSLKTLEGEGSPVGAITDPGSPDADTRTIRAAFNAAELEAYCAAKILDIKEPWRRR